MRLSIEQADRAMDIIRRLSLFAKAGIDSEIKLEPVKISEVIENILPLISYELTAHQITLEQDIPQNLPEVRGDRRYLEEIFFNLIVNAAQAIKEEGDDAKPGKIAVRAVVKDDKVLVTVSDTGPGISEEKVKDVFRPFYTTRAEGTGLGLYITKQLVEKIGGRISVNSVAGQGTVFNVSLSTSRGSA